MSAMQPVKVGDGERLQPMNTTNPHAEMTSFIVHLPFALFLKLAEEAHSQERPVAEHVAYVLELRQQTLDAHPEEVT